MFHDNRGMTLIEVMIALMLLAITSLALIQSALVAMNINVTNELRDEAVSVAEQRMNELRNTPFTAADMLVTPPTGVDENITRSIRSNPTFSFTINRMISQVNTDNRQVSLTVIWNYKDRQYRHGVSTVMRQK